MRWEGISSRKVGAVHAGQHGEEAMHNWTSSLSFRRMTRVCNYSQYRSSLNTKLPVLWYLSLSESSTWHFQPAHAHARTHKKSPKDVYFSTVGRKRYSEGTTWCLQQCCLINIQQLFKEITWTLIWETAEGEGWSLLLGELSNHHGKFHVGSDDNLWLAAILNSWILIPANKSFPSLCYYLLWYPKALPHVYRHF